MQHAPDCSQNEPGSSPGACDTPSISLHQPHDPLSTLLDCCLERASRTRNMEPLATEAQLQKLTLRPLKILCTKYGVDHGLTNKKKDVHVQRLHVLRKVTASEVDAHLQPQGGGTAPRPSSAKSSAARQKTYRTAIETYFEGGGLELLCSGCGHPLRSVREFQFANTSRPFVTVSCEGYVRLASRLRIPKAQQQDCPQGPGFSFFSPFSQGGAPCAVLCAPQHGAPCAVTSLYARALLLPHLLPRHTSFYATLLATPHRSLQHVNAPHYTSLYTISDHNPPLCTLHLPRTTPLSTPHLFPPHLCTPFSTLHPPPHLFLYCSSHHPQSTPQSATAPNCHRLRYNRIPKCKRTHKLQDVYLQLRRLLCPRLVLEAHSLRGIAGARHNAFSVSVEARHEALLRELCGRFGLAALQLPMSGADRDVFGEGAERRGCVFPFEHYAAVYSAIRQLKELKKPSLPGLGGDEPFKCVGLPDFPEQLQLFLFAAQVPSAAGASATSDADSAAWRGADYALAESGVQRLR